MSIRTTITLDDDVAIRLKQASRSKGASFRDTVNELLRSALLADEQKPVGRTLLIRPTPSGYVPGLNYDSVGALLEYGEGERHR